MNAIKKNLSAVASSFGRARAKVAVGGLLLAANAPTFAAIDTTAIIAELGDGKTAVVAVMVTIAGIFVTMFVYHLITRPVKR